MKKPQFVECPDCLGEQRAEREVVIGGVDQNGPWQSYRTIMARCDRCDGMGVIHAES